MRHFRAGGLILAGVAVLGCHAPHSGAGAVLPKVWHYDTSELVAITVDSLPFGDLVRLYTAAQEEQLESGACLRGVIDLKALLIHVTDLQVPPMRERTPHSVRFSCTIDKQYLGRVHTHLVIGSEPAARMPSPTDAVTDWWDRASVVAFILTGVLSDGQHDVLRAWVRLRDGRQGELTWRVKR